MKFSDILCLEATVAQFNATDRDSVIRELVDALNAAGKLGQAEAEAVTNAVITREEEASTGLGKGVAVPHVKCDGLSDTIAAIGRSSDGIDFTSLDKKPTYTVILLLSPADNPDKHLQAMESIFRNLQNDDFRRFLRQAQTAEKIREVVLDCQAE